MTRRAAPPQPQHAVLTLEQKRLGITRIGKRINDLEAFDPQTVQKRFSPEVTALNAAIKRTLADVFGHGTVKYHLYLSDAQLDEGVPTLRLGPEFGSLSENTDLLKARQSLAGSKQEVLAILREAVRGLEEEIAEQSTIADLSVELASPVPTHLSNKVFVVHGHDDTARHEVARFLEHIKLEAIVLREQPDQGRTIIEKFEDCASEVGFAVVLLTPDDLVGPTTTSLQASRGRQNVIFELGYFIGKLGRGRACLLRKGEVEIPSDLYGVIYTDLDAGGGWKLKLVRELTAAKLDFDATQILA